MRRVACPEIFTTAITMVTPSGTEVTARNRSSVTDENSAETPLLVDNEDEDSTEERPRNIFPTAVHLLLAPITDEHGSARSIAFGMVGLIMSGVILGAASPKNHDLNGSIYPTLSAMIGWIYFLMWSVSFYPQLLTNYRRKTTMGLSADFCALNVLGFACYATYNMSFFYSTHIQDLYKRQHFSEVTVQSNDVAFAVHAFVLASFTLFQIGYYDGFRSQRPSKMISGIILFVLGLIVTVPLFIFGLHVGTILDYLYMLSYIKLSVTLIKYIPQVVLNFQRKSTAGWSIWQILLDFSGGLLSILQLVLDCHNMGDWTGITGNLAKFCLGFVSVVFDLMFITQHYILYPRHRAPLDVNEGDDNSQQGAPLVEETSTQESLIA